MRKFLNVILFLTIFSSCNLAGGNDKYSIQGTLKNSPVKSIMLEKLGLQKITQIDSAKVDDKGNFKLAGVTEKGFYRLKLDDRTFFLLLIEPKEYKVDIDLANQQDMFKVSGSKENEEFQAAFKNLGAIQRDLQGWNQAYQMYSQMHAGVDTIMQIQTNLQMLTAKFESIIKDSSKTAKSPLVAMFYVTNAPIDKFPKENEELIARLDKEMPNSSYTKDFHEVYSKFANQAKEAASMKATNEKIAVGKPAPEIDLNNPEGKSIKLSSLKGKVVLLDFWASWCGPCRMEMPNVVAAYNKYKDKGFTIYSVSLDKDANAWKGAIDKLGMTWPCQVSDLKWWQSKAALDYGVQGIPMAYLLDKDGNIVASNLRGAALEQKIAELLK